MSDVLRLVNWNVEWARPDTSRGEIIRETIDALRPDVVCLTEAHTDFIADGYVVTSTADYGYGLHPTKRKVVLWSRQPWNEIDSVGDARLPGGRFVSASTRTPLGRVSCVGVCVPWKDAHVTTGRRDRTRWQDHIAYLEALTAIVESRPHEQLLLIGDFNQTIPRTRAPENVFALLERAIARLNCATSGALIGTPSQAIDHICHSSDLICASLHVLSNVAADGTRLSDHFGLVVEFTRKGLARLDSPPLVGFADSG